jgi:serine protease AprX
VSRASRPLFRLTALTAGLLASGVVMADAFIEPALAQKLAAALPSTALPVVVSYKQSGPVTQPQLDFVRGLGITRGVYMRSLPVMGLVATPALISQIAKHPDVVSIYANAPLRHLNFEQRQMSGSARVYDNAGDFGRALPYSGRGVTVMVNDSGIDTTNPDLPLGTKVVDNVQAAQNFAITLAADFAGPGILPIVHLRNQINTDLGSGHGTHVAGTVGGSGTSSGGKLRGAAPGADLLGYGSGGVLLILDAVGGLDYALSNQFSYRNPVRVTSNSWGTSGKFEPLNPVNISSYELYKKGIVSVFAAGNDGPGEDTHNPYAQAPWVVSVGASEKDGVLTGFSSRGKRGESGSFTMPDGVSWTYTNQPTIVANGVDIVSTRALTGALPLLSAEMDATLPPAQIPYYTHSSGTSMATPHVSGVIAQMMEANPNLTPLQARNILKATATNMTSRDAYEVGAGHLNAYAAVAMAQGLQTAYGSTVKTAPERSYFANQLLVPGGPAQTFNINFAPVGTVNSGRFMVGKDAVSVTARATTGTNTVAVVLIDPTGKRYGSSVTTPVLGETAATTAPAVEGEWQVTVRGIGSVSGVALDPLAATNGIGAPETIAVDVTQLKSGGFSGLSDIANHPARTAIQYAVGRRLVDGLSNGTYGPDYALTRGELAQYLVLSGSLRQSLPFPGKPSASGLDPKTFPALFPYAEMVASKGAVLRDLAQNQQPVLPLKNFAFNPDGKVTRLDLAYSLVQSLAMQAQAEALIGSPLTAFFDGKRVPVEDAASIPLNLQGYAQLALDTGVLVPRFALKPSLILGGAPTVVAYFEAAKNVSRADYAFSAGRFETVYRSVED